MVVFVDRGIKLGEFDEKVQNGFINGVFNGVVNGVVKKGVDNVLKICIIIFQKFMNVLVYDYFEILGF